jgi:hypothetical protein
VTWRGRETVANLPDLLEQAEQVEVVLPQDYNHVLFRTLNPEAPASAVEAFDVSGGPELLKRLAAIRGLEALGELGEALRGSRAGVRVLSPPVLVIQSAASD